MKNSRLEDIANEAFELMGWAEINKQDVVLAAAGKIYRKTLQIVDEMEEENKQKVKLEW